MLEAHEQAEESTQRYHDQHELNEILIMKQRQLRTPASDLVLTEQRERKRLATELHDYLAQMMAVGRLKIGHARPLMATDTPLAQMIEELDDIFTRTLSYTRTLMAELSPPVLHELGLPSALKWLADQAPKQYNLTVEVALTQDQVALPEDQALLLYQSVRELLLNVVKHAHTSEAAVSLTVVNDELRVVVMDHGRGFNPVSIESKAGSEHFGLFSIRERMDAIGGWFQADSAPGLGTTITLGVPLTMMAFESQVAHAEKAVRQRQPALTGSKITGMHRLLLVDDHAMVRQGLRAILQVYPNVSVLGEATNGFEAISMTNDLLPDIILMDVNMPKMDGIEATRAIKAAHPTTIVIGLSVNNSAQVMEAMRNAGAATFVSKDAAAEELYKTIAACDPLSQ